MPRLRDKVRVPNPLIWLGIGVLAAVVCALVLSALRLGNSVEVAERPVPTVTPQTFEPAPEPAPTAPALPELQPSLASLSTAGDEVFWRASASACSAESTDNTPVIERSEDGQTWAAVTPAAAVDVREVLWLQAINASSAEAVVRVGPACETQVLRTFTSGNFWEPYPNSITGAAVVDAVTGVVRTADAELPLPCTAPAVAVSGAAANTPIVLCSGQVATWSGDAWQTIELANVVAASVSAGDGALVTAREATSDCDGMLLERWAAGAAQDQRCVPGSGVLAVQAAGEQVWLWSAAGVEVLSWAA